MITINATRLAELAARLKEIIEVEHPVKATVAIGEIDGIHFRLEAYSPEEKIDADHDDPLPQNVCLSVEGGAV